MAVADGEVCPPPELARPTVVLSVLKRLRKPSESISEEATWSRLKACEYRLELDLASDGGRLRMVAPSIDSFLEMSCAEDTEDTLACRSICGLMSRGMPIRPDKDVDVRVSPIDCARG